MQAAYVVQHCLCFSRLVLLSVTTTFEKPENGSHLYEKPSERGGMTGKRFRGLWNFNSLKWWNNCCGNESTWSPWQKPGTLHSQQHSTKASSFSNIEKLLVAMGAGGSAASKVALRGENAVARLYFDPPPLPPGVAGWCTRAKSRKTHWWHGMSGVQTPTALASAGASLPTQPGTLGASGGCRVKKTLKSLTLV